MASNKNCYKVKSNATKLNNILYDNNQIRKHACQIPWVLIISNLKVKNSKVVKSWRLSDVISCNLRWNKTPLRLTNVTITQKPVDTKVCRWTANFYRQFSKQIGKWVIYLGISKVT